MDFGVFTSGGDGSPKGVLHFSFLVACYLLLKKPKLLFFDICLIIRYRGKIYLYTFQGFSAAYWPCDIVSLQKHTLLFPKTFT